MGAEHVGSISPGVSWSRREGRQVSRKKVMGTGMADRYGNTWVRTAMTSLADDTLSGKNHPGNYDLEDQKRVGHS